MVRIELRVPKQLSAAAEGAIAVADRDGELDRLYAVLYCILEQQWHTTNIWLRENQEVVVDNVAGLTRLAIVDQDEFPWVPTRRGLEAFVEKVYGSDWRKAMSTRALDIGRTLSFRDWCRINAGFVQGGELQLVVRRHPAEPLTLEQIAAPPELLTLVEEPRGLILFVGRTAAGKSTTMAAALDRINRRQSRHIIRIEDPHEIPLAPDQSLITVREVGRDVDSADLAVMDALRQRPDVISVSEVRNRATVEALLDASDAGHLVLGTGHGPNPVDALARFVGLFGQESAARAKMLAANLLAVVGQVRLPRRDGTGYNAYFEVLVAGPPGSEVRKLIAGGDWQALRERLNNRQLPQSRSLSDSLARAVAKDEISRSVGELNAFDRSSFQAALDKLQAPQSKASP